MKPGQVQEVQVGTDRVPLFNLKEDPWETNDLAHHPDYADDPLVSTV